MVLLNIHIGKKVREVFEQTGMSVSEFARRIKTTRQNVYGIFERSSVDTALLLRIGTALNHNFFSYYSEITPSKVEEPQAVYGKKGRHKKVMLQIEIEDDKQSEILKLALGDSAYKALKKKLK